MANFILKKWPKQILYFVGLSMCFVDASASSTGNLPFNSTMEVFKTNFMSWMFGAAVVLWVATCLMLAFGEWGEGIKRIINILFWLSLAFGGASGITMIFGTGAVI